MQKYSTGTAGVKEVIKIIISQIENDVLRYQIKEGQENKVSVIFLAGAPGSGKTEFILSILKKSKFFFLDIDSYRDYFDGYEGNNSQDYQKAISSVVDGVTKYCFQHNIRFILDGTFKSLIQAKRNIEKCQRKKRKIDIYFIFQDPYVSYYFTFLRKLKDERHIPVDGFIECFYESIRNIFLMKEKYKSINLYICEKMNFTERVILKKDYKLRDDIVEINSFCKLYQVAYNSKDFSNKEILKSGIHNFDRFLQKFRFIVKIHMRYIRIKNKVVGQRKKK